MLKRYAKLTMIFISIVANHANASFWPPSNTNTTHQSSSANKILSPDEFKKRVNELNQQNQVTLNTQAQQLLSKQPVAPVLPPPPTPLKKESSSITPGVSEPSEKRPVTPPTTETATDTPVPLPSRDATSSSNTSNAPTPDSNYSGFIGTHTNNNHSTSVPGSTPTKSTNGWGVKY